MKRALALFLHRLADRLSPPTYADYIDRLMREQEGMSLEDAEAAGRLLKAKALDNHFRRPPMTPIERKRYLRAVH